jgi:multidrug efflux pump subunit AcrB
MWLVRLALRRPYTIAVSCLLIMILGVLSLARMTVDIFPVIDIPVVVVVWNYPGLSAQDMERRVVLISERAYSTTVNGISRIESQSISGIGLLRVYFQPGTDIGAAIAQISSVSSTLLRIAPPGMTPPNVIQFSATNVPVAQLTVSSKTLPEQQLFDYGLNFIRVRLFTIPGLSTPAPFGGKDREIIIDINPQALAAKGLSAGDVVTALQSSNVILPAGDARIGGTDYIVQLNSSPDTVAQFSRIPIKVVGSAPVLIGDVAQVHDSFGEQRGIVHVNGKRATYLAILKHSDASTLAVVEATREALPVIKASAPEGMDLKIDFDQSVFVRAAIVGVVREAILSSILVSLMILIFLGSWRSMVVVCTSIPLAIFTAIIGLNLSGDTVNIMTLGGLALAIGMLVDDATVEIENINRNFDMGKPITVAILDGASQIAVPAIVATLAICIVFFPVVLLTGAARYLFTPMALSVVLAMLASYILSRTLVPTLSRMLFEGHRESDELKEDHQGWLPSLNRKREHAFERLRSAYGGILELVLHHRVFALCIFGLLFSVTAVLPFVVGTDFFPSVDVGLMKLHVRAPVGTRLEDTEQLVNRVESRIREIIPDNEIDTINDLEGIPTSYNLAYVPSDNVGDMDTEVLIALKPGHHPSEGYMQKIREQLPSEFPGSSFYFQSADIVSQVLNFGVPTPVDVQVEGANLDLSYQIARQLRDEIATVPGAVDVHIKQAIRYPALRINVDREKAAQLGLTEQGVANSMLISLSSSALVGPSYFLNPTNNVNYIVAVRIPPEHFDSVETLMSTPLSLPGAANPLQAASGPPTQPVPQPQYETLANVSSVVPASIPAEINHYTVQRVLDINANLQGRDLGSVVSGIQKKIDGLGKLPVGMRITVHGQYEVMNSSFRSLLLGLILAIVLVYLLIVVLFQSWMDPFIIMIAVPGALIGILWMLAITGSTINVESLMGSIMAVGIATSNSILMVSYANDARVERNISPIEAALEAGKTRLRPVLMTALAMIIGMIPMALALGEAGEQNAPLGRAVIGGLLVATVVTLFVVPVVYTLLRKNFPTRHLLDEKFAAEARGEVFAAHENNLQGNVVEGH